MAVNRNPDVRCALVGEPLSASLAREHNDANVLALGARLTGHAQVTIDLARAPVAGEALWYGYGTTPYCQLVDIRDRALPTLGPEPLVADG